MLRKAKKIDDIYYCVLSSSTTEQEVKMAEGFMRLLPFSGFPGDTSPYRHLLSRLGIIMPNSYSLLFCLYRLGQGGYATTGVYLPFSKIS